MATTTTCATRAKATTVAKASRARATTRASRRKGTCRTGATNQTSKRWKRESARTAKGVDGMEAREHAKGEGHAKGEALRWLKEAERIEAQ